MNYSTSRPKGNNYWTGRLREVFIMGIQCLKTLKDRKSTGLMTVQGILIMKRVEWRANYTAGWMTSHATPTKRTPFTE